MDCLPCKSPDHQDWFQISIIGIAADVRKITTLNESDMSQRNVADGCNESGIGLPHSKTSRNKWRAIRRASVLECGCPLPL